MNLGPISTPLNPGSFFKPFIPLERGAVEGFALEMTRRASQTAVPEGKERTVSDEGLQKAIEGAVGFVEENFGDRAARVFMGIVLKDASGRAMDEGSMGDAFVNGLEFLDRTFGIAAGDKAMAFFNGELNQALNGYFQNGKDESFLAMELDEAQDALGQAAGQAISAMMKKFTKNAVDPDSLLMNKAKDDLDASLAETGAGGTGETVAGEMAPLVDENGFPVEGGEAGAALADGGVQAVSAGQASQPEEQAAQAAESRPGRRAGGSKRRGRGGKVRRRRVDSGNPYDRSGLTPGQVLDKKV
ncbi:MAG: hypothetical protein ACOZEN_03015 [Thermodesulfobacteriota bacterium]